MGLFCGQLLLFTVILHRFGAIATPVAVLLLAIGIAAAMVAVLLAVAGLVQVWSRGRRGAAPALAGLLMGSAALALPLWHLPDLLLRPRLTDVTTAADEPLQFQAALSRRPPGANPLEGVDPAALEEQTAAYPDLRPMALERSANQVFDLVRSAVERLGWTVIAEQEPSGELPGRIEAVARTPIMGFADDVVIRVTPEGSQTRIDVRSASRFGTHDFGANAGHIRSLFAQVSAGLEEGERMAREIALAKRAQELREAREARLARERAEREAREEAERAELERIMRERTQTQASQNQNSAPDPAQSGAQGGQERRGRQHRPDWFQDPRKFWQQFGG